MTELGLLSDCFAVCVSSEQVERLKGGARVPITSVKGLSNNAKRHGQEAKYPTNLLKSGAWFSGTSRSAINRVLFSGLQAMKRQMEVIEHYVEQEFVKRFEFNAVDLRTIYNLHEEVRNILWQKVEKNGTKGHNSEVRTILKTTDKNNTKGSTSVDTQLNDAHRADLEKTPRKLCLKMYEEYDDVEEIF